MKTVNNTLITARNEDNAAFAGLTLKELSDLARLDGIDKIEVFTGKGWQYLLDIIDESGFEWDDEETTEVNLFRFSIKHLDLITTQ
jgi:hypothetical protein